MTPPMPNPEATARAKLPCAKRQTCNNDYHSPECPAHYRPAIAQALADAGRGLGREELIRTIRGVMVEDWNDAYNAQKWKEDILLTACRLGRYAVPEEAANAFAGEIADALLAKIGGGG